MIRINLLAEGRRPVIARKAKPRITFGDQDPSLLLLIGGLVLGLLVAGFQWWRLSSDLKEVGNRVREAQREVEELKPILQEVEDFKAKQAELQRKIDVINDLTLKQKGPVHIMDQVSQALPDLLWLSAMRVRGSTVEIDGAAFNTNAIATFIENLDKVPEFKEPDPKIMQRGRDGQTYSFKISFNFIQQQPATDGQPRSEDESGG